MHSKLGLLKKGARWRIGSRRGVKFWNKPWLPDAQDPFIHNPVIQGLEIEIVNSLRSVNELTWDMDLLHELFNERDKTLIS